MSPSGSNGLSRRFVLGALAGLPALPGLLARAAPAAGPGRDAARVVERRAGEAGDPRFHPRDHRTRRARTSCRRRSASRPSTRTARLGRASDLHASSSIASTACRPWSRRSRVSRKSSRSRRCSQATSTRSAKLSLRDFETIAVATLTGMDVDDVRRRSEGLDRRRPRIIAGSGSTPSSPTSRCRRC